jgi:uncharacterized iron-regulated protein
MMVRNPFAFALASFAATLAPAFAQAAPARPLASVERGTTIWSSKDGAETDWPGLIARLSSHDAVFLGETHLDDMTHRVELAVLEGLIREKKGKVVLSLEMFERDVQPAIDAWQKGEMAEAEFLQRSRPWGNYVEDYRPLLMCAKQNGVPIVAANFPAMLRRKLGMGGKDAVAKLSEQERAFMPDPILPASEAYWQRVERATRGHMGSGGQTAEERLYDGQNLWDNAMGDAVSKAVAAHAGSCVLHIAGGFHTAYRDGTVAQFAARSKDAKFATVAISAAGALHRAQPQRDADEADYIVYGLATARSEFEGTYAVTMQAELRYRLHVPHGAMPHGVMAQKAPLFVWVPDASEDPEDALAFWSSAIGDAACVAVVEHAFPQPQPDLGKGGAWQSGDGFRADYGAVQSGIEQIVEYLTRRMPVDDQRTLIAGSGAGGAVAMWTALYSTWLRGPVLAIEPHDLTRLSMEALPDKAPTIERLVIAAGDAQKAKVDKAASDYASVGAKVERAPSFADGKQVADFVRAQLRIAAMPASSAPDARHYIALDATSPRARQWAETLAAKMRAQGKDAAIVGSGQVPQDAPSDRVTRLAVGKGGMEIASFADGAGIPLAGGSFGGTTVLVLPAGASDEDFAAWKAIEDKKAIKRRSMFANLAIARADKEPTLPQVIESLRQKGRSRVLICPASFCESPQTMQALQSELGDALRGMDAHWLPGLGAALVR